MGNIRSAGYEVLDLLMWGAEKFICPTWGSFLQSYDAWDYYNRGRFQLRRLEREQLVETEIVNEKAIYRLTEKGRLKVLGGMDPEARWRRPWDRRWRLIMFDLPVAQQHLRKQLLRWLGQNHFGYLQHSVWISPDPIQEVQVLKDAANDVGFLTVMEAGLCTGYDDAAIIRVAWDFTSIGQRYDQYLAFLKKHEAALKTIRGRAITRWYAAEREAWRRAIALDPFLPAQLLPRGYQGREVWKTRCATMSRARDVLRSAQT